MSEWWAGVVDTFERCFVNEGRYMLLVNGIGVTIKVSLLAMVIGVIIGFLIALCNLSDKKPLNVIGKVYTDVIRGTPSVTQLMIIYFVVFATINWSKWIIAAIAFGINSGAYVSEIIRAGIMSIDKGQTEAARSLGLNYSQTMRKVVLPQAVKICLPSLVNQCIITLKDSTILYAIGLAEIMYYGKVYVGRTFAVFATYTWIAVFFLAVISVLSIVSRRIEDRLKGKRRHRDENK